MVFWLVAFVAFWLGFMVRASWYEYRVVDATADYEGWIARDQCEIAGTGRFVYARCPRLRLP
jgi:hypothetical protein